MPLALNNILVNQLQELSTDAEEKGRLTVAQLNIIYKNKWLKLFVPKEYGGLQLSLPQALRVEEKLAYLDGSLGWTITLCAGANLFAGYIDKKLAARIFTKSTVCWGGSGAVGGVAEETTSGYIINGFWKYATGAPHLTHFTANCSITKNNKPVLDKEGKPVIRSFFFNKTEVSIYEDWHAMGLKATAGHSFSVKNLHVKKENAFTIDAAHRTHTNPVYQYPFLSFANVTLAVNILGMTIHFFEEVAGVLQIKQKQHNPSVLQLDKVKQKLTKAESNIALLKEKLYRTVESCWQQHLQRKCISPTLLKQSTAISQQLVAVCRRHVADLYPYCGVAATAYGTMLNRIFRDIFTASQHQLLNKF